VTAIGVQVDVGASVGVDSSEVDVGVDLLFGVFDVIASIELSGASSVVDVDSSDDKSGVNVGLSVGIEVPVGDGQTVLFSVIINITVFF